MDDVEARVRERQRAGITLDVRDLRVALAEACPVVETERREPAGPGVALLEEVVRGAPAVPTRLAERDLVDADVEDRGGRVRPHLVEEERQLPPPRTDRDRVGEAHVRDLRGG